MPTWIDAAYQVLLRSRTPGKGWGYRLAEAPAAEPTALASLALLAHNAEASDSLAAAQEAEKWLRTLQDYEGAVRSRADDPPSGWNTPYALLLWFTLGIDGAAPARAKNWLLTHQGLCFEKPPNSPLGHDTTIPGWNWAEGTHSWLEPTSLAILALRRGRLSDHPRVQAGLRLVRDRVIPEGGWNFGNNTVFGVSLRPKPGPTGLALLALAGTTSMQPYIRRSLDYLARQVQSVRSAQSLGLGLAALRAWDELPPQANDWLAESFDHVKDRPDAPLQLAYLLLAAGDRGVELLGLPVPKRGVPA